MIILYNIWKFKSIKKDLYYTNGRDITSINKNLCTLYSVPKKRFILLRTLIATLLFWILACFTPQQKIDKKDFKTFFYASFFGMVLKSLN